MKKEIVITISMMSIISFSYAEKITFINDTDYTIVMGIKDAGKNDKQDITFGPSATDIPLFPSQKTIELKGRKLKRYAGLKKRYIDDLSLKAVPYTADFTEIQTQEIPEPKNIDELKDRLNEKIGEGKSEFHFMIDKNRLTIK